MRLISQLFSENILGPILYWLVASTPGFSPIVTQVSEIVSEPATLAAFKRYPMHYFPELSEMYRPLS